MQIKEKIKHVLQFCKKNPQTAVADAGLLLYLCVYTLILHDHLFDLMKTRIHCFYAVTAVMGVSLVGVWLLLRKKHEKKKLRPNNALKLCDLSFAMFLFCSIAAWLLSAYPAFAWNGKGGRYMGTATLLCIGCTYWMLTRYVKLRRVFVYGLSITVIVSVMLGYLHFAGIDPLHLFANVRQTSQKDFISVFGNLNVFSSFLCLAAPLFMTEYCCSEKQDSFFELMISIIGFIGLLITNSDSGYIGFGCAFVIVCLISLRHSARAFRRWIVLVLSFCVTAKLFSVIYTFSHGSLRIISKLTRTVTFSYAPVLLIVLCVFLLWLTQKREPTPAFRKAAFFVVIGVCVLTGLGLIAAILFFSTAGKAYDLGYWKRYLRFDDLWGTGRGFIWRYMLKTFADQTWYRKLFGTGADTIGLIMKRFYLVAIHDAGYPIIDNAHNELLQYLVTHGIVGLVYYLALSGIGILYPLLHKSEKANTLNRAFAAGAFCYLAQSVVNLHQPITTPLYFVFLSAAMSGCMVPCEKTDK